MNRRLAWPALLCVLASASRAADPPPADLAEFKSTAHAVTTRVVKQAAFARAQPGHLGIGLDLSGNRLRITRVEPGSAAETAGLRAGDVLRSIDGQVPADLDDFKRLLHSRKAGQSVGLVVERRGESLSVTATLTAPSNPLKPPEVVKPVLGVDLDTVAGGVQVRRVVPGSPAEDAGLRAGDVLTRIDDADATSFEVVLKILAGRVPGETVTVHLLRDHKAFELAVELAAAASQATPTDMPTLAGWDERSPRFRKPVYRLAVVPVGFADVKLNARITAKDWDDALFSTGTYRDRSATGQPVYGSMNDYYRELSCNKFNVEGRVFDGVVLPKKRTEYTQTSSRSAVLAEAADALLQRDGDEALKGFDGLFFVYAGGRFPTQRGGIFWPHRASFGHKGRRWPYFICPEMAAGRDERMASISVISHEFGHMLGLPDLYFRTEAPELNGLGVWCTMSVGHGHDGRPLHFSAWCKEQLGWLKPVMIDPRVPQKLVLSPVAGFATECFKVLIRPDGSEYLLLENRVKKGFDRELPGEGLLIWRVVDNQPVLEVSHGVPGPDGPRRYLGAVPYPSSSNRAFTPDTTPSSRPTRSGGWNVHITDIRRLADGRITLQIGYEYY